MTLQLELKVQSRDSWGYEPVLSVVGITGRNGDSTNRDDGAGGDDTDDGLPPIEDIPDQISRQGISTEGDRNAKATTR